MSSLIQTLEAALAAAKTEGAMFAEAAVRIAELERENGELLDEIHALKVSTAPTEPPAALPVSIALAKAAVVAGLTLQQARALFGAVTPEEAATISRLARAVSDRAAKENSRRQARRARGGASE